MASGDSAEIAGALDHPVQWWEVGTIAREGFSVDDPQAQKIIAAMRNFGQTGIVQVVEGKTLEGAPFIVRADLLSSVQLISGEYRRGQHLRQLLSEREQKRLRVEYKSYDDDDETS